MPRFFSIAFVALFAFAVNLFAQIPTNSLVNIVKAEDERRFDATLENLLKNADAKVRERAALAAGRIGDENALSPLSFLLRDDKSPAVRRMAAFAIGEIESGRGSEAIIGYIGKEKDEELTARLLEAAGKIAAANPKHEKTIWLGRAIVEELNNQSARQNPNTSVILLGLTAVLRSRPEGGEAVAVKFLNSQNADIRATALNTLARLRSKIVNEKSRELLKNDKDAVVRANAARMLGVGEDKESLNLLLDAATKDEDSRVRVGAVRALGSLKDASVAEKLIPNNVNLSNKNELLEIAAILGRLLPNTNNQKAIEFLTKFAELDEYKSPEIDIAFAQIAPSKFGEYQKNKKDDLKRTPQALSATFQGIAELAKASDTEEIKAVKETATKQVLLYIAAQIGTNKAQDVTLSDAIDAYSALKGETLTEVLHDALKHKDPIVRTNAAGLIANQPSSKKNIDALNKAFNYSFLNDKHDNDATLAILDALFKLDKKEAISALFTATTSQDYLVRKKAAQLLKDEAYKDSDLAKITLDKFYKNKKNQVLPYQSAFQTKLGQVLNSNADYVRAVSRKNGTVKAVFTTSKGVFTINLTPEDAPLTVDNFIKLAKANYFNGLTVHRVVANFVMQDGDPRGDGNGGPGWSIRCEVNMLPYKRGAVGMALSGKDTGGSQWFVTHSPQPHLDGGYTVFGQVNETDMKVVDSIVRGDKIINVKITGDSIQKTSKKVK
jgi:cyclophilin family peptidyl-prolyl cis-trans isomerase/HEAT repeat protein